MMDWTPPVTVSRMVRYGYGILTVYGADELHWQVRMQVHKF